MIGPKLDARTYAILILMVIGTLLSVQILAQRQPAATTGAVSAGDVANATRAVASATSEVAAANREIALALKDVASALREVKNEMAEANKEEPSPPAEQEAPAARDRNREEGVFQLNNE